jgi:hypothetical protein
MRYEVSGIRYQVSGRTRKNQEEPGRTRKNQEE